MYKRFFIAGSIFIMVGIIAGAFGAHALNNLVVDGEFASASLKSFETASRYAIYSGLSLLLVGIIDFQKIAKMKVTGNMMLLGALIFCGSIFLLSLQSFLGIESLSKFIGPITPLGGILLIGAWIPFIIQISKR